MSKVRLWSISRAETGIADLSERIDQLSGLIMDCLPARLRDWYQHRHPWIRISISDTETGIAQLSADSVDQGLASIRFDLEAPSPRIQWPAGFKRHNARFRLELPGSWVLVRRFKLPMPLKPTLMETLRLELNRLTPFEPEEILCCQRILSEDRTQGLFEVELAYTLRSIINPWLSWLKDASITLQCIRWPEAWPGANLLSIERRQRPSTQTATAKHWLGPLGILVLATALVLSPLYQRQQALTRIQAELDQLAPQLERVEQRASDLADRYERRQRFATEWAARPDLPGLLLRLTRTIPDNSWLDSMVFDQGDLELRGESDRATALVDLLQGASAFEGVAFRSPLLLSAQTERTRFHLGMRYRPDNVPPSIGPEG